MPVQPTVPSDPSVSAIDEAALVAALSHGELAVAIHTAGPPASAAALSTDQIRALAVTGIALLGLAEARRIGDESRLVNVAYCTKARDDASADVRAEVAAHHRIWGTWRQEQTAIDLAHRLSSQRTVTG